MVNILCQIVVEYAVHCRLDLQQRFESIAQLGHGDEHHVEMFEELSCRLKGATESKFATSQCCKLSSTELLFGNMFATDT